ncbi:unnamed protein product [Medioppia subpectinata]|uniref:Uncharacterized protein n=1 Tax=Medioppia subpectinata TaxID=1979941 RepID=A0A7R9KWP9_9ACAR|nr:unnamed protein product [Medioppia subpectinata]CAG2109938.1 unnamed protein product [Medioppia subpectinata]
MTASITVTDLVEELSAENRKLVDGLSVWQKCVELVHNYKKCLTDVLNVVVMLAEYADIDTAFRSLEDSQQKRQLMAADSGGNGDCDDRQSVRETGLRTLRKPKRFKESDEEISDYCPDGDNGSDAEADDNEKPAVNMKFLAEDDCLVEEDGLIVTKRDPNNGLILVVQLNNTSGQALGFRCNWSDCQFVSVSKDKTADHLRTVHNRTGHFVCHKCPKTFVSCATILRDAPFSSIYWLVYEKMKAGLNAPVEPPVAVSFVCGATAGTVSGLVTHPFDVVKTHRQTELGQTGHTTVGAKGSANRNPYKTSDILAIIYREKGLRGLFAGIWPRVMRIAPGCAIMITTFECGKTYFRRYNDRQVTIGKL